MKKILKNKKFIMVVILSFIALAAFTTSFIFLKKDTNGSSTDNDSNTLISFVDSSIPEQLAKDYDFVNEGMFEVSTSTNLFNDCQGDGASPLASVNVTNYFFNPNEDYEETKEELGSVFMSIFGDMPQYIDNHELIKTNYEDLVRLLNEGEITTDDLGSTIYKKGFRVACGGEGRIPIAKALEFNYPKTDKAYLVIGFGSYQSTTNSNWMPLDFKFVSKIGNNYSVATANSEYKYFTHSNNLAKCEEPSGYDYDYINTFSENGKTCVIDALEKDLDQSKINQIIQKFITTFALK